MLPRAIPRAVIALSLLLPCSALLAQRGPGQTSVDVAAGVSVPTGGIGSRANTGFDVTAGLTFQQASQPVVSMRLEGSYNEFSENDGSGNTQITGITANVVLTPGNQPVGRRGAPPPSTSGPYVIAGLGFYDVSEPATFEDNHGNFFTGNVYSNDIGFNFGGGYKFALSGFDGYIEVRYHTITNTDYSFVPIVFGLTF